ncbi:O-antigen ligase family protein [Kiritimatiellota bacterium B12222]|nr:O-antigen ligase family protein [Kiritimatiellota bacterium B12222]
MPKHPERERSGFFCTHFFGRMFAKTPFIYWGLIPLITVPVWAAGGTYTPWQSSFPWLCLWAWCCYFITSFNKNGPEVFQKCKRIIRDPLFLLSAGFLSYLLIQHLNSGRIQIFDFELNKYSYSPPPFPKWPWSVTPPESKEMLNWFAPALTLFLILRYSWSSLNPQILIWWVCLNGFLNALLSFMHQAMGWEYMYNFQKFGKDVYGSFGYPNHAAIFFTLLFAIALGLFFRETLSESSERDTPSLYFSAIWTLFFFLAANFSTSRAGILGAWLVLGFTTLSISIIAWPRIHPVQRVYGILTLLGLIATLGTGFILFAPPAIIRELKNATVNLNIYREIDGRFFQIETAWKMWKDYPIYGVGGWGYRYFVYEYLPENEWGRLNVGKANVHNDFMQFLAEFGLIGMTLLSSIFIPMISRHLRNLFRKPHIESSLWANPLRIACAWGLFILALDCQFDIPLRSPAIVLHAIFMLYLLGPHPHYQTVWSPVVDWQRLQPPLVGMKNRIWGVQPEQASESIQTHRLKKG